MDRKTEIYENVRIVPENAKKAIGGGRLKGMTDINPMFRIRVLTEQFGPCGIGWRYEIVDERLENGANNEIAAFVRINLYIYYEGKWSYPIPGTGGSSFVASESKGLYTSDECFKMALTDALSVACKALGVGADVYWNADSTKCDKTDKSDKDNAKTQQQSNDSLKEIAQMLTEMYGEKSAPSKLEELTAFKGKNDQVVLGVKSLKELKDKRLTTTYNKIKKLYENFVKDKNKVV
jgi:hypothetical protein